MKRTLFILALSFISCLAFAQAGVDTSLKFDRRYTQCELKWVVVSKTYADPNYLFGFVYLDAGAGFTFQAKGAFTVDKNNHYILDTALSAKQSLKYRIARNWGNVALVPASRFSELNLKPQPGWVKYYYTFTDTVTHNFRWGFIYNDLDQCDTALVYLKKAYAVMPHYPGLEFELIFAYNTLKRYDDAISVLTLALQNDPKNALFYRELGYAFSQKEELEKSLEAYTAGIQICTNLQMDTKSEMAIDMANVYKQLGVDDKYKIWGQRAKAWATPGTDIYKFIESQGF